MKDREAIKQAVKDEWFMELIVKHLNEGKDGAYIRNSLRLDVDEYVRLLEMIVKEEDPFN